VHQVSLAIDRRLDEDVRRVLNRIRKPSTAEEITEWLNRDLGPGDQPFQAQDVANWLHNAEERAQFILGEGAPAQVSVPSHSSIDDFCVRGH
jgi:hypothetical protein